MFSFRGWSPHADLRLVIPFVVWSTALSLFLRWASRHVARRWLLPKPIAAIPHNKLATESLLGDASDLRNDVNGLARWCSKQLDRHGSPICQALLGGLSSPVVLIADVGDTRKALLGRNDFDRSAYIIDRFPLFGGFHLNMKTDDAWRRSRAWLKDLMAPQYLHQAAGPCIHRAVTQLIRVWDIKACMAEERPFTVTSDIRTLTLDVIMSFHFGHHFADSGLARQLQQAEQFEATDLTAGKHGDVVFPRARLHRFQEELTKLGDKINAIYTTKWPPWLVSWWTRWVDPRYRTAFAYRDSFVRAYIRRGRERMQREEQPETSIERMVLRDLQASAKTGDQPGCETQRMVDEVSGNLIAGQHTTSAALVWILKMLTDHPHVQARLRDEIRTACSLATAEQRPPTSDEIINTKMPYLDAVLEETLRLRAAMIVPRDAIRDTTLLGYAIPKGTVVLLVCQGPDYSPSPQSAYWRHVKATSSSSKVDGEGRPSPDVSDFDPDRWLVRNQDGQLGFDASSRPQLAFGMGIRACWGRRLARLELRIFTVLVVTHYHLLGVHGPLASHEATYDISYRARNGYVALRGCGG